MENDKNTSKFLSGDRVEAFDQYGNFHKEKGTVVGFKLNSFKRLLANVRLDSGNSNRTTYFYTSELTLLERPEPPVSR